MDSVPSTLQQLLFRFRLRCSRPFALRQQRFFRPSRLVPTLPPYSPSFFPTASLNLSSSSSTFISQPIIFVASSLGFCKPTPLLFAKKNLNTSVSLPDKERKRAKRSQLPARKVNERKAKTSNFPDASKTSRTSTSAITPVPTSPTAPMSECFMYSFSHPSSGSRKKPSFYAVAVGRQRGIYSTWKQCSEQVTGFRGAVYKGFRTLQDAREFLEARPVAPSNSREERLKSLDVDMDDIHSLADFEKLTEEQRNRMGARLAKEAEASAKRLRDAVEEAVVLTFGDERNDPRGAAEVNARYMEKLRSRQQVVYVDGACRHNGTPNARAGYGGYYGDGDARNFALPVPLSEAQTNNRGELRATIHAIVQAFVDAGAPRRALAESHTVSPDWNVRNVPQLIIYTDSRYVIDGLTRYSQRWVQNGFILATKQPVLNQDLWKQLIRLRDAYNNRYSLDFNEYHLELTGGYNVHNTRNDGSEGICLKHVKGHSNVHGNEMADSLAVEGAMKHRAF